MGMETDSLLLLFTCARKCRRREDSSQQLKGGRREDKGVLLGLVGRKDVLRKRVSGKLFGEVGFEANKKGKKYGWMKISSRIDSASAVRFGSNY
jgi:hypothetical protein